VSSVTRKDSELWKRLVSGRVQGRVLVGIPEGAGLHGDTQTTVAQVAQWLHDGTATIPPRPFLSVPLDGRTAAVQKMARRVSKAVLDGKLTEEVGLTILGQWARDHVLQAINASFPPPNAPSTVAAKGSSLPLVDTAQLKGSIGYEIKT
jgi:hypothetical protein